MKNDSKSALIAKVDVRKAKYSKSKELGIDFANEIDVWARMEFRSRQQIKQLQCKGTLENQNETLKDAKTLFYAIRETID